MHEQPSASHRRTIQLDRKKNLVWVRSRSGGLVTRRRKGPAPAPIPSGTTWPRAGNGGCTLAGIVGGRILPGVRPSSPTAWYILGLSVRPSSPTARYILCLSVRLVVRSRDGLYLRV
jgi:hypothetical protein